MRRLALGVILAIGCQRHAEPHVDQRATSAPPDPGLVPHARAAIAVDGAWNEPEWNSLALTGDFIDSDGQPARPVSQVRLLADDRRLLVGLYAADEDIRTTEQFDVSLGALALHFDPRARVTPVTPGVHATVDTDGTLDTPEDHDEEWVIEAEVPLALVGLTPGGAPIAMSAHRCDVTKDGVQRCGAWVGAIHLAP